MLFDINLKNLVKNTTECQKKLNRLKSNVFNFGQSETRPKALNSLYHIEFRWIFMKFLEIIAFFHLINLYWKAQNRFRTCAVILTSAILKKGQNLFKCLKFGRKSYNCFVNVTLHIFEILDLKYNRMPKMKSKINFYLMYLTSAVLGRDQKHLICYISLCFWSIFMKYLEMIAY